MTDTQHDVEAVYSGPLELVEIFQGLLQEAGITARVVGTDLSAGLGSAFPSSTELWVNKPDFDRAAALIAEEQNHRGESAED